jgi:hypothetical protein
MANEEIQEVAAVAEEPQIVETEPEGEAEVLLEPGDFVAEFAELLTHELFSANERHGDEWRYKPAKGQVKRIVDRINQYYTEYTYHIRRDFPWLSVAGLALIGWLREAHPELLETK